MEDLKIDAKRQSVVNDFISQQMKDSIASEFLDFADEIISFPIIYRANVKDNMDTFMFNPRTTVKVSRKANLPIGDEFEIVRVSEEPIDVDGFAISHVLVDVLDFISDYNIELE